MEPGPAGAPMRLLDHVDEGGDVVLGDALPLVDRGDVEAGPFPDGHGVGRGHHARASPTPRSARISTSSQARKRASSVKRPAISGSA